jgi:hypothetical protein
MNSRQTKTLKAVFAEPTPANVAWADIESLLIAVGCVVTERKGSGVRFDHGEESAWFHRPHPGKEAKRYQVRDARELLSRIGVKP